MAISEDVLEPYRLADTVADAERVLDELAPLGADLPDPVGDLYDELAEAAAEEDDYALAARLERKALEDGCTSPVVAREMLGWYLLKSGDVEQGERVFMDLQTERPDDVGILITLGHARSDSGMQEGALSAFDEAVAVAKQVGHGARLGSSTRRTQGRARGGRGSTRRGRPARSPLPRPPAIGPIAWTLAWFPAHRARGRAGAARSRWRLFDHPGGLLKANRRGTSVGFVARSASAPTLRRSWSARWSNGPRRKGTILTAEKPGANTRQNWASTGGAITWPPGRNDACWCRSGQKYKRCCGRD